jgi:hypothetical protein
VREDATAAGHTTKYSIQRPAFATQIESRVSGKGSGFNLEGEEFATTYSLLVAS